MQIFLESEYVWTIVLFHTLTTQLSYSDQSQKPSVPYYQPEPSYQAAKPVIQPSYQTTAAPVYQTEAAPAYQTEAAPAYQTAAAPAYQYPTTRRQTTMRKRTTVQTTTTPQRVVSNQAGTLDYECGVPDYNRPPGIGLVINGRVADRGQFPWLAAYYHNGNEFKCGGSLISNKIVVTAAHCIYEKKNSIMRKAEDATMFLGRYNLNSKEETAVFSAVTEFMVHPEWNQDDDRFDADIAIAVLTKTIVFNSFVKPICMWTATSDFTDLVGKNGVVAGWGKTEQSAVPTPIPKWTEIPVVDTITCLQSSPYFSAITSGRTFCGGKTVKGEGPCSGDSGQKV